MKQASLPMAWKHRQMKMKNAIWALQVQEHITIAFDLPFFYEYIFSCFGCAFPPHDQLYCDISIVLLSRWIDRSGSYCKYQWHKFNQPLKKSYWKWRCVCLFVWTSSSTTRLYRGRAPRLTSGNFKCCHTRDRAMTMTSISAAHIIRTPTHPVGSGRPQRGSNPGPPHQVSRALPIELPRPQLPTPKMKMTCIQGLVEM